MIKAFALILTVSGMVSLVMGVLGIFGKNFVALSPWALAIIGLIFFAAGVGLLKR
jgi:hypothetical protein